MSSGRQSWNHDGGGVIFRGPIDSIGVELYLEEIAGPHVSVALETPHGFVLLRPEESASLRHKWRRTLSPPRGANRHSMIVAMSTETWRVLSRDPRLTRSAIFNVRITDPLVVARNSHIDVAQEINRVLSLVLEESLGIEAEAKLELKIQNAFEGAGYSVVPVGRLWINREERGGPVEEKHVERLQYLQERKDGRSELERNLAKLIDDDDKHLIARLELQAGRNAEVLGSEYLAERAELLFPFMRPSATVWVSTTAEDGLKVVDSLRELLAEFELGIEDDGPSHVGSWWQSFKIVVHNAFTSEVVQSRLGDVELALHAQYIDKQTAENDEKKAASVAKLMDSLKNIDKAVIVLGQLIVVKSGNVFIAKSVDPRTAARIERTQTLLSDPDAVIGLLSGLQDEAAAARARGGALGGAAE